MADVNREEILADFQACTGIHDIEESIAHLQNSNWDLLKAINNVVPQDSQTLPSERNSAHGFRSTRSFFGMDQDPSESDVSRMDEDDIFVVPPVGPSIHPSTVGFIGPTSMDHMPSSLLNSTTTDKSSKTEANKATAARNSKYSLSADFLTSGPSSSKNSGTTNNSSNREIVFSVRHGLENFDTSLAECETIETLKTLIQAQYDIPPCQQMLSGWPKGDIPKDSTRFGSLSLPNKVNLTLSSAFTEFVNSQDIKSSDEDEYQLIIQDKTNDESYPIKFAGTKTVRGVKEEIYSVTDIPVRLQVWTGWPAGSIDEMTLNACGLDRPNHTLTVRRQVSAPSSSVDLNKRHPELTDGSETSSDVEDLTESYPLEEDYFVPEENHRQQKFLISENALDEAVGTIEFSDNFAIRYGACHPMFFHGTLEDAVREACQRPAKTRKLLAMYLHHDGSVTSNVFCQQTLCNESVVSYITNNFVVWGWDVTNESNRQLLLAAVNRNFGPPGVATIRSLDRDRYPVIIIVSRVRSATEVCSVISNTNTVDELMGNLMHAMELFQTQQKADVREEEEREARERVKREQDEAYEASLSADRAKDEAKRVLEQQKINEEQDRLDGLRREEEKRAEAARALPPEPGSDSSEPICSLKCRLPGGKTLSRKFINTCPIQILFNYLFTEGYSREQYRVLTTYPKRDLTAMPETTKMKDVFSAQDTFIVEER